MHLFDYTLFAGKSVLVSDLDMSIVNNRERRKQAEERGQTQGKEVDYDFFYSDESLALDQPMAEQLTLLWHTLEIGMCDQLCYLSSRPTSMWYGTSTWLHNYGYPFPYHLLLRRQFQKTLVFKREELETIARYATQVFFFDDSDAVRQAATGLERVTIFPRIEDFYAEYTLCTTSSGKRQDRMTLP